MHVVDELSFALAMDAYAGLAGDWLDELRKGATKLLAEAAAQAAREGVEADTVLIDRLAGAVHEQVIAEAQACDADLIVVGTHGRRGIGRWVMGSSAEQIVRMAPVPVLLVRAPAEAEREHERFPLSSRVLASL
ncbi:MAG: universal stress protein [Comamonadaceae bacterium]|nr:MAG: universal stress protein [Comamonadaceae bacterium]